MYQSARDREVGVLIDQLRAGFRPPTLLHHGARLYFPPAVQAATPGTCLVCATVLIGQQEILCAGHWDWVMFEPLELIAHELYPIESIIEFLVIFLRETSVWSSASNLEGFLAGTSLCEVCGTVTANTERLLNRSASLLKEHIVCPEHQSFRSEDDSLR